MSKLSFLLLLMFPLAALAQPGAAPSSGVEGVIFISPAMGGPTRAGVSDAKPLPDTEFVALQGDRVVASFRTDKEGRFRVSLGAGHYSIVRKNGLGLIGSYGPFEVDVTTGKMKTVQWTCDSGIR